MIRREDEEKLRRKAQAILMMRRRDRTVQRGGVGGGNLLDAIKSNFQFWSDGTVNGSQLTDKSGNNRHATLTSNLITLGDYSLNQTSWVQSGGTAPTTNAMINSDLAPGGTSTMQFAWSGATLVGHKSQNFVVVLGDVITVDFWFKRVTSGNFTMTVRDGNGFNSLGSINLSLTTDLIGGSVTVGQWGHFRKTFSASTAPGGLGSCVLSAAGGTYEVLMDKDISITVSGQTNNCFIMPQDADLKANDAIDSKYLFYTSAGVSLTTRAAYQYNSLSKRIYCGGPFSYIFLTGNPSITVDKIIADNFEDLDHAFDSCPIVLTVGSGKTYALPQTAINVATTGVPDFRHRRRIECYDNITVSTYAEYTATSGGGFKAFIHMSRQFDYITSVGGTKTVTLTKEVSLNDAQSGQTEGWAPVYTGGIRGFNTQKTNGGYVWHQDFTGNIDSHLIVKDCTFEDNGAQGIYDYRIANAQALPTGPMTGSAQTGGMQDRFLLKVSNVTFASIYGFTWQDAQVTNGTGGTAWYRNCTLTSKPIYDNIANPTSATLESIRLTSSGGTRNTQVYLSGSTRNSTVNKVGAVESIFLTES